MVLKPPEATQDSDLPRYQGVAGGRGTSRPSRLTDQRGPVRENSAQAQTRLSASNQADLPAAYADGLTLVEVGLKLGISHNAVRCAVVACGGTLRPAGRRPALVWLLRPASREHC